MSINIRSPREGDESRLAELCAELGYPAEEAEIASRLLALAKRDDHAVLVAADEQDIPIAWVHVHLSHRIMADAFAELGGIVVSEEHRGKGIGEQLLAEAERWGIKQGVDFFRVRSNAERKRAHPFYLRAGYRLSKTSYVFDKSLS